LVDLTFLQECCGSGVCKENCCSISTIYGKGSEEVELLGKYCDEVLSKTPEGRKIIRLYYEWSPIIVQAMEEAAKIGADAILNTKRDRFSQLEWTDVHYHALAIRWK